MNGKKTCVCSIIDATMIQPVGYENPSHVVSLQNEEAFGKQR